MDFGLILDWLGREGGDVLSWWVLVTLAGLAVWPLLFRILGGLPDRGYTLARTAGLMLTGFVFWFLASVGLLRNTPGGMVFAWVVVLVIALVAFLRWDDRPTLRAWAREHSGLIIVTEVLFLLLFFGWAIYRAHNPEMRSTEKPMEIMFLNGIRSSEIFPPRDPWLSGYAISYYYFGYVIAAMLADLSGVTSGIAFNLTIALLFALTGIGALGVVYNLVRSQAGLARIRGTGQRAALGAGLLAVGFLILMGNLGTALIEFPYRGYASGLVNEDYFKFWDVEGRDSYFDSDGDTVPDWADDPLPLDQWSFTWGMGWRYSRVVHDRDLNGDPHPIQPITEFPNFSFVLADIHPHVLALPFGVLALGLMLNLVLGQRDLLRYEYPLYAIWIGGMVFMNSWDAIFVPLLIAADVLRRLIRRGTGSLDMEDILGTVRFAAAIALLTLTFYAPWIISFTSQAGGILPNVIYPTPWQQFFLQFGTFLVILVPFLLVEVRRAGRRFHWQAGLLALTMGVCVALLLVVALGLRDWANDEVRGAVYSAVDTSGGLGGILPDILTRRLIGLPSELLLLGMVFLVAGRLFARPAVGSVAQADISERTIGPDNVLHIRSITYSPATGFVLLLIGTGAVLTFAPDFVYLRDNFAVRINTVFKLYYQGWIVFSLAGAYAVWSLLAGQVPAGQPEGKPKRKPKPWPVRVPDPSGQIVFAIVAGVFFLGGMTYPLLATRGRALVDTGRIRTKEQAEACQAQVVGGEGECPELPALELDGTPEMVNGDEYAAVQCLLDLERDKNAVLAEAPGGAYEPDKSRFSGLTGIPTLIGWQNHERQWRGKTYDTVIDSRIENGERHDRVSDVQMLYTTLNWDDAWAVIDYYGIDYVVVGYAERQMINQLAGNDETRLREYNQGLAKFEQVLQPVCQSGSVVVYRVAPE
jgi:YYY domain-containing protein